MAQHNILHEREPKKRKEKTRQKTKKRKKKLRTIWKKLKRMLIVNAFGKKATIRRRTMKAKENKTETSATNKVAENMRQYCTQLRCTY